MSNPTDTNFHAFRPDDPNPNAPLEFKALGKNVTKSLGLEPIPLQDAKLLREVTFTSDEVTGICPVTGQPDWYTVRIDLETAGWSIESKSLKLYLQSFRDKGLFCEQLADEICKEVCQAAEPKACNVTVTQKSRGGITLVAVATRLPYPG